MSAVTGIAGQPSGLLAQYRAVRAHSEALAAPLSAEDCAIQSMPDASPVKWHLAHTSWFFETLILAEDPGYRVFDSRFNFLFKGIGQIKRIGFRVVYLRGLKTNELF